MRGAAPLLWLLAGSALAAPPTVTSGGLSVTARAPGDRAELVRVFALWRQAEGDLRAVGLTLPPTRLDAARDAADFASRTGGAANIAALTRGGTIFTQRLGSLAGKGLLAFTLRHEAFHRAQPQDAPRWLAEGLARIFSGEARADAPGPTGLERLSAGGLSERLAARDPAGLNRTYREATRRAARELRQRGWREVWNAAGS